MDPYPDFEPGPRVDNVQEIADAPDGEEDGEYASEQLE